MNHEDKPNHKTLLLVFESRDLLKISGKILQRTGYSVSLAEKSAQARGMARAMRPDCVIIESGPEKSMSLKDCAAMRDACAAPIIFMSDDAGDAKAAIQSGDAIYVKKPIDYEVLIGKIAEAIKNVVQSTDENYSADMVAGGSGSDSGSDSGSTATSASSGGGVDDKTLSDGVVGAEGVATIDSAAGAEGAATIDGVVGAEGTATNGGAAGAEGVATSDSAMAAKRTNVGKPGARARGKMAGVRAQGKWSGAYQMIKSSGAYVAAAACFICALAGAGLLSPKNGGADPVVFGDNPVPLGANTAIFEDGPVPLGAAGFIDTDEYEFVGENSVEFTGENSVEFTGEDPADSAEGIGFVAIPAIDKITVPAGSFDTEAALYNPKENSCYFIFEIALDDPYDLLYKSGLVGPGKSANNLTLSRSLKKGAYGATLKIRALSNTNLADICNAVMRIRIIAE